MAIFAARCQVQTPERLLAYAPVGQVRFYELKRWPRRDADTYFAQEEGHNVGDAESCPACGAAVSSLAWLPPFRAKIELYGNEFGDLAFGPGDSFLVSQKFREVYYEHGLTGLKGFDPVEVVKIRNKSRQKLRSQPPMYFRVSAMRGQMALDMAASGFEWVDPPTCPHCRTGNIKRWKRLVLEPGTWTGEDAFRPWGSNRIMVSRRFKDACERHLIKNAVFTSAEEAGHDFYPGKTSGDAIEP